MSEDYANIYRDELNFHLMNYSGCLYVEYHLYPVHINMKFNALYIIYNGSRLFLNIID